MIMLTLLASAVAPSAHPRPTTPSEWHRQRRAAILEVHPEVQRLTGREAATVPALVAINGAQLAASVAAAGLPSQELIPLAVLLGGTLSLWQFALLHDLKHGTASLPRWASTNAVVFAGSLPALFGYYLYLRHGHLSHHRSFGSRPLKELFDSEQEPFEDGDVLFVAHRQLLADDDARGGSSLAARVGFAGKQQVGGLGLSISRTLYSLLWLDGEGSSARPASYPAAASSRAATAASCARALYNACVYSFSMILERAALVLGGGVVVALTGRNYFFAGKPQRFHDDAASYARASLALALALYALCGPGAIAWLFFAEVGWQLPVHPASAMFVSNHPSLPAPGGEGDGVAGCQPTSSIYLGDWYDWLCCFSNYHCEHHDFPDVPAFRLKARADARAAHRHACAPGAFAPRA